MRDLSYRSPKTEVLTSPIHGSPLELRAYQNAHGAGERALCVYFVTEQSGQKKKKTIGPIACAVVRVVGYNAGCYVAKRITKPAQS